MMYIKYVFTNDCLQTVHIGERITPETEKQCTKTMYPITVQADGDELSVCANIVGRSMDRMQCVHVFVGDQAREIVANWNIVHNHKS